MADEIKSLDELNAVAGGEAVAEVAAPREPVRDEAVDPIALDRDLRLTLRNRHPG